MKANPTRAQWLTPLSKTTCLSTLILIFVGGMVTSTGSGLAVPDWPLSYGTLFPPMVGGVFYEHGHRMAATFVGFLMLCLAIALGFYEPRRWVRTCGFIALGMVILQGLLGGLTVLFFLPTPISVMHGVLAQTFFIMTIIIAYSLSHERKQKENGPAVKAHAKTLKISCVFIGIVYLQLVLGAIMRHTYSGLAIPDFPTMGGAWLPLFNDQMLMTINERRFDMNLDPVSLGQVWIHFIHRAGAALVLVFVIVLTRNILQTYQGKRVIIKTVLWLLLFVGLQIFLGIASVLTQKAPRLTSVHVVNGAAILGGSVLLLLRMAPLKLSEFKRTLCS